LEICLINAVQREVELLESLSFHPEISLSTTDCVELSFLLTKEHATAGISVDRHETTSPTDELRTLVLEHGLLNRIEVDVQSRSDSLGFTHVLELNRLPREHRLIDIGMLELS